MGGTAGGRPEDHRHPGAGAGCRGAQDLLPGHHSKACCAPGAAPGGTVGAIASPVLPALRPCGDAAGGRAGTVQRHCRPRVVPLFWAGWVLLVVVGYKTHPVDPPGGTHRQTRVVFEYWDRLRRARLPGFGRPCHHPAQVPVDRNTSHVIFLLHSAHTG